MAFNIAQHKADRQLPVEKRVVKQELARINSKTLVANEDLKLKTYANDHRLLQGALERALMAGQVGKNSAEKTYTLDLLTWMSDNDAPLSAVIDSVPLAVYNRLYA